MLGLSKDRTRKLIPGGSLIAAVMIDTKVGKVGGKGRFGHLDQGISQGAHWGGIAQLVIDHRQLTALLRHAQHDLDKVATEPAKEPRGAHN